MEQHANNGWCGRRRVRSKRKASAGISFYGDWSLFGFPRSAWEPVLGRSASKQGWGRGASKGAVPTLSVGTRGTRAWPSRSLKRCLRPAGWHDFVVVQVAGVDRVVAELDRVVLLEPFLDVGDGTGVEGGVDVD